MTFYSGDQDPTFPYSTYVDVTVTPAVVRSNRTLTAVYVASQVRNAGRTSEQLQGMLGLTDNEIRACVDACDRGYL